MSDATGHFVHQFQRWVRERPDHPALVFIENFDKPCHGPVLTYAELDRRVRAVAYGLVRRGLTGERVLLLHPPGQEFTVALLGCFHAGVVAVPAPLPGAGGRGASRLTGIVDDAAVACVLTAGSTTEAVREWIDEAGLAERVSCLVEEDLAAAPAGLPTPDPSAVAFLQYTSGSTSEPKGVMVTHAALAHNEAELTRGLQLTPDVKCLSWLPHYHDMGLIGQLLGPLHCGGTVYLMSPLAFLKRPHRWLQAVSDLRATITVGPDFAYVLATRRTTDEQLAELDLSCLRAALNGSEPIHAATLDRFVERFSAAGLRPDAMVPCYGLAEATLFVTGKPPGEGHRGTDVDAAELEAHRLRPPAPGRPSRRLVSSGRPVSLDVRIVDPDTGTELPDGEVGEVWIAGPSVAAGYWGRPDLTQATFGAQLKGTEARFLRTGDLGTLQDGELFVTGRIKEMLIINGRNLYPQDLERTIRETHAATARGATAVFTVDSPGGPVPVTRTVAVQEVRPKDLRGADGADPDELITALQQRVRAEYDLHLGDVVLVPIGQVARTTSGKIQRGAMRSAFLAGELRVLHRTGAAPRTAAGTR
ncbi:fatty acyl-AMP ligase [Streptomyces sp. ACA25]|uniref:fatty acyl-AMP ligase n=1 Tax=Streptomyces sp. ACA25 TaxID=3022596 RepID=UPI0023074E81|nr:fatty acyl-AMP ligase [Streptomyces sp. ACA25]MDB1089340.1 fatty acyl-AMP ligase [Streptomyces sp. ACA25]